MDDAERAKRELQQAEGGGAPSPASTGKTEAAAQPVTRAPAPEEGVAWRAQLSEKLAAQALELHNAVEVRRRHMAQLVDAAERLERKILGRRHCLQKACDVAHACMKFRMIICTLSDLPVQD